MNGGEPLDGCSSADLMIRGGWPVRGRFWWAAIYAFLKSALCSVKALL